MFASTCAWFYMLLDRMNALFVMNGETTTTVETLKGGLLDWVARAWEIKSHSLSAPWSCLVQMSKRGWSPGWP